MQPAPEIGHFIPPFQAQDSKGNFISPDTLLGRSYILYFYPKNDVPACVKEDYDVQVIRKQLNQLNTELIGISPNSADFHNKFLVKSPLCFHLISDPYYELCSLFKVWKEKKVLGHIKWDVIHTTFIIDAKGIIRWIEQPVQFEGHFQRIMQALQNLPKASAPL